MKARLPPRHIPFLDANGCVADVWYRWLTLMQQQAGGYPGPTWEVVDATTLRATVIAPDDSLAHVDLTVGP